MLTARPPRASLPAMDNASRNSSLEAALAEARERYVAARPQSAAVHAKDVLLPAMAEIRSAADRLEVLVADDLWPLPTYQEMLFIR